MCVCAWFASALARTSAAATPATASRLCSAAAAAAAACWVASSSSRRVAVSKASRARQVSPRSSGFGPPDPGGQISRTA
eukprot:430132-Prorocentrum_minimum.AAC.1